MVHITVHIKKVNTVIVLYKIINSKSNTGYDPYIRSQLQDSGQVSR